MRSLSLIHILAARALETALLCNPLVGWIEELGRNIASGNVSIHNGYRWDPDTWPETARGFGFFEAPRGSLGHWVQIEDKAIKNYQAVVPSTWNAGPRDAHGQRGAYEAALINTPVADPERCLLYTSKEVCSNAAACIAIGGPCCV